MSKDTSPLMPIELLEQIIFEAWNSPLLPGDRICFMTSSLLVSKIWMTIFVRISFKNVHIPCASYLDQYMSILRGESSMFDENTRSLPDELCESITVKIEKNSTSPDDILGNNEPKMGKALSDLLYTLYSIPYVPNLRKITVIYEDMGFSDLFDCYRLIAFPTQVTSLELKFMSDPATSSQEADALREKHSRQGYLPCTLPSIRQLSFFGASDAIIADMISCCPNLETYILTYSLESNVLGMIPSDGPNSYVHRICTSGEVSDVPHSKIERFVPVPAYLWELSNRTKSIKVDTKRC